jgi:uncharacterized protein (DUF2336 family)
MAGKSLIPELEDVIRYSSSSRRADALRRVGSLFAETASRLNDDHVLVFDDVLCRLLDGVEVDVRVELAHLLGGIDNAPCQVVHRLVKDDDIAVARPMLRQCPRVAESDLVEIAETRSAAHLLALSKRKAIGPPLTDILIRRANRDVLRSLADNGEAHLTDANFAALIDHSAQEDGSLAQRIAIRPDIAPRHLRSLVLASTPAIQQRLLATTRPELQAEIRRVLADSPSQGQAGASYHDYAAAERRIADRHRAGNLGEASVVELAEAAQQDGAEYDSLVASLALLCEVPIGVVDRLMASHRSDPVLILCRSIGWGWATAKAIMSAMPGAGAMSSRGLDAAFDNFERLSPTTAQRVKRFWQAQFWQDRTGST